jgi:hypothetical protein
MCFHRRPREAHIRFNLYEKLVKWFSTDLSTGTLQTFLDRKPQHIDYKSGYVVSECQQADHRYRYRKVRLGITFQTGQIRMGMITFR